MNKTNNTTMKAETPSSTFELSGTARIFLRIGRYFIVSYVLKPVLDTEICVGALAGDAELINLIVAKEHVTLHIGVGQWLDVHVDGRGKRAGEAMFTCHNPLLINDVTLTGWHGR